MAYVWLAAVGLLLGGYELFRLRSAVTLGVLWFSTGVIFTANYVVLDLLHMYFYLPGLLPGLLPDATLGVFLAELVFLSGWTLWVVYRFPAWAGATFGTIVVVALEALFRRYRLFEGHTWQLWHTMLAFPPYFLLIYWFRSVAERQGVANRWVRTVVRISITLWWTHLVGMVIYWVLGGLMMQIRLFDSFGANQTLGAILTVSPFLNAAVLWVMVARERQRVVRLLWSAAGLLLIGQFWVMVGLWRFRAPWDLFAHTAAQLVTIYIATLCDDWVEHWEGARAPVRS